MLNPINVCEYDGGLAEVALTVECAGASPMRIRVVAVQGKLPAAVPTAC